MQAKVKWLLIILGILLLGAIIFLLGKCFAPYGQEAKGEAPMTEIAQKTNRPMSKAEIIEQFSENKERFEEVADYLAKNFEGAVISDYKKDGNIFFNYESLEIRKGSGEIKYEDLEIREAINYLFYNLNICAINYIGGQVTFSSYGEGDILLNISGDITETGASRYEHIEGNWYHYRFYGV